MNEQQQFNSYYQKISALQNWLMDLLKALLEKNPEIKTTDEARRNLIEHLENGQNCACYTLPVDDLDYFENLLKNDRILAVSAERMDPTSKKLMRTYIFRDKDLERVETRIQDYLRHLDGKCHELDLDTFMAAHETKNYFSAENLSMAEINVFRENAQAYNMDYVVVRSADDNKENRTYSVLANDQEMLNKCITDTFADLVGRDGNDYMERMEDLWTEQSKMMDLFKNSKTPIYIIDAYDLGKVIEIDGPRDKSGKMVRPEYSLHDLSVRVERHRDGSITRIPNDNGATVPRMLDKSILSELRSLEEPVILTKEEAEEWLGASKHVMGKPFIVGDQYLEEKSRKDFTRTLRERNELPVKRPLHAREERAQEEGLNTYTNLPYSIINTLRKEDIDGVYIVGNDVAYVPKAEKQVKQAIRDTYGDDVKPLDIITDELKYMARGNVKLYDLDENEEYVVFDFSNPSKVVEVVHDKTTIRDADEECDITATDYAHYQEKVTTAICDMKTPVAMTLADYNSEKRSDIAWAHIMASAENSALLSTRANDAEKKERYHELVMNENSGDEKFRESLTPDELELLERRDKTKITIVENDIYRENYQEEKDERYHKKEIKREIEQER